MKKIVLKLTILFLSIGIIAVAIFLFLLGPVDKNGKAIYFKVETGSATREVLKNLKEKNLIKSEFASLLYAKIHPNYTIKAGTFSLSPAYSTEKIFQLLNAGDTIEKEGVNITFVEGKRLSYYVDLISDTFSYEKEEIYNVLSDEEYLQSLIDDYWFITDEILDSKLYYPLEGYLYPETYNFATDSSIKTIINKLIYTLGENLEPYKEEIENSKFTFHQILSLASDVEIEGNNETDRKLIAGVFLSRLRLGMQLGSDVTTYYAVKKDLSEKLWYYDISYVSDYNTRLTSMAGKINIGPICNPSIMSIKAILNPTNSDYLYFYADWQGDGKVYYSKTYQEHSAIVASFER